MRNIILFILAVMANALFADAVESTVKILEGFVKVENSFEAVANVEDEKEAVSIAGKVQELESKMISKELYKSKDNNLEIGKYREPNLLKFFVSHYGSAKGIRRGGIIIHG